MPDNAEAELLGCGTHDQTKVAPPTCPISHDEAVELIKSRLRACWWGPRAVSQNYSADAGAKVARAKEWEMDSAAAGWGDKPVDVAAALAKPRRVAPQARPRRPRPSKSPSRRSSRTKAE